MKNTLYLILPPALIYLIFSWAPKYFGCFLPEKYCLDGIDKVGDILTISIALIPVFILFEAYNIWRKQKSAELLAVDARGIYKSLKDVNNILLIFKKKIIESLGSISTSSTEYIDLKSSHEALLEDLELFDLLLKEEESKHLEEFEQFHLFYKEFGENMWKLNIYRIRSGDNTAAENHKHAYDMLCNMAVDEFISKIKAIESTLSKIILHK